MESQILEYGLELGKFGSHADQARTILASRHVTAPTIAQGVSAGTMTPTAGNAKRLEGSDVVLTVPDYDDLDLI